EVERPGRPGALVENFLVRGALDFTRASLDGARDRVVRHRLVFGVGDRLAQSRVAARVASSHARRHRELFDELGEELAALGVEGPFFVFDRGPFRVAAHARTTSLAKIGKGTLVAGQYGVNLRRS